MGARGIYVEKARAKNESNKNNPFAPTFLAVAKRLAAYKKHILKCGTGELLRDCPTDAPQQEQKSDLHANPLLTANGRTAPVPHITLREENDRLQRINSNFKKYSLDRYWNKKRS